jgi:hypothetical protein
MRSAILLVLAGAVGACGHPTYGRPAPRDTMPTTKAPGTTEPKPNEKPVTKELTADALAACRVEADSAWAYLRTL